MGVGEGFPVGLSHHKVSRKSSREWRVEKLKQEKYKDNTKNIDEKKKKKQELKEDNRRNTDEGSLAFEQGV